MKRMMVVGAIVLLALASRALSDEVSAGAVEGRLFGTVERFEWEEFSTEGERLLKESGPLYGIGAEMSIPLVGALVLDGRGRIFFGDVDYDGSIQTPTGNEPYQSSTSYTGYELEGLLGYAWVLNDRFHLKPYAGAGLRNWQRTLDADLSDDFIGPWGYVEYWAVSHWTAGLEGKFKTGSRGAVFCRLEARLPYDISEEIDLSNVNQPSDVSVSPDERTSFRGEVGYAQSPFLISFFAETQTFGASELDDKYAVFNQPKSELTILGLKLGLAF